MTGLQDVGSVRLDVAEVAAVVGLTDRQVRDLVPAGVLVPAERGGKGRGRTHKFDAREVLGLAVQVATWRGCGDVPVWLVVDGMARHRRTWSLTAVEHVLGLRGDPASEEALAKAMYPELPEEWQLDPLTGRRKAPPEPHPEDQKRVKDWLVMICRLRYVVLAKLGGLPRGRGGRQAPRKHKKK